MPSFGTPRDRLIHVVVVLITTLAVSIAASPQRPAPWEQDSTTWSVEECGAILEESPWARTKPAASHYKSMSRYGIRQWVRAQFRSAWPIRAALQCRQMKKQLEKLAVSERRAKLQNALLKLSNIHDQVVIRVEFGPSTKFESVRVERPVYSGDDFVPPTYDSYVIDVPDYPDVGTRAFLLLQDGTRVNPIRRKPSRYAIADWDDVRYFELTFPRSVNGKELFDSETRTASLLLVRDQKKLEVELWRFDFRVDEMSYQGKLEY